MERCPDGLHVLHARAANFPFALSRKQHYLQMMSLSSELDLLHPPFFLALEDIQGASREKRCSYLINRDYSLAGFLDHLCKGAGTHSPGLVTNMKTQAQQN